MFGKSLCDSKNRVGRIHSVHARVTHYLMVVSSTINLKKKRVSDGSNLSFLF